MNVTLYWRPLAGVRGGTESTGLRFVVRPRATGGMELIDRREKRKYPASRAEPLRAKAAALVAAEATLPPRPARGR